MLSLKRLAEQRHSLSAKRNLCGIAGSNGSWKLYRYDAGNGNRFKLFHYSTLMLDWVEYNDQSCEVFLASQGWNSKSDQGGMNTFFWNVGIPLYFSIKDRKIERVNSRNSFLAITLPAL